MSFYRTHILPRFLDLLMRRDGTDAQRPSVVARASGVVAEIGFGSGLNLPHYKGVAKLYAVDPSQGLYDLARERVAAASFPIEHVRASAEDMPLEQESVDAVVSTWSLCSIPHPERALQEVRRILKPGGTFSFIEHGIASNPLIASVQRCLTPVSRCFAGGCHMDRDIERLVRDSGLEVREFEKFQEKPGMLTFTYQGVAVRADRPFRDSF